MTAASFIYTLFIFFGLFSFAGAAVLLTLFKRERPIYVTLWALGCILTGLGVCVLYLNQLYPGAWFGYKLANSITFFSGLILNYALSSLNDRQSSARDIFLKSSIATITFFGILVFVSEYFGSQFQPVVVAVFGAIVAFYGFLLAQQFHKRTQFNLSAALAITYLLIALLWTARVFTLLLLHTGFAFEGGSINVATFMALLFLGILRYMFFAGLVLAVSERKKEQLVAELHELKLNIAHQSAIQSEQQLQFVLNATGDGIWDWNILTGEVKHNQRWIEMLEENKNQRYFSILDFKKRVHPDDLSAFEASIERSLREGVEYRIQYRMLRLDGRQLWVEDAGAIVERSASGEPVRMVGAITDVTEEKIAHEKIQELIFFDHLTKLPNRQYIKDRIQKAIEESVLRETYSGLMYIDLDDFKRVNDSHGHHVGDILLREFGLRIQSAIRPADIVARIGGDEYLVLFEQIGLSHESAAAVLEETVQRILLELSNHFDLGAGILAHVQASIGIAVFGNDATQLEDVLKCADLAMYAAKTDANMRYRFFDQGLKADFDRKNELHLGLREAARSDQFFIEYQPVVNRQKQCVAYEALARWAHPILGVVMPDDFIPYAETSGQINEVGEAILRSIFNNAAFWNPVDGSKQCDLMINISAHQLMNSGFADQFINLAKQYQIPLKRVHLEVTEGAFLVNTDLAISLMRRLQERGVQFVLDDFGTGYSSLAYLQKLPIEYLKIDKSFVCRMVSNRDDEVIVDNILSLAKSLGLQTIAEGVENQEQFNLLHSKGCEYFQGWHLGKPSQNLDC